MQNVMLPDLKEWEDGIVKAEIDVDVLADAFAPGKSIADLRVEVIMLKGWLVALYAKHGEECPLFKEE